MQVTSPNKRLPNTIFDGDKINLKRVLNWLKNEYQVDIKAYDSRRISFLSDKLTLFNSWLKDKNKKYSTQLEDQMRSLLHTDLKDEDFLY